MEKDMTDLKYFPGDTLQQLSVANFARCPEFGHKLFDWSLPEWGNATAGEVGELCNVIKKVHRGTWSLSHANAKNLIADEAADVVIYLDMLCQRAGVNLKQAIVNKFNRKSEEMKSKIRISAVKHPTTFSRNREVTDLKRQLTRKKNELKKVAADLDQLQRKMNYIKGVVQKEFDNITFIANNTGNSALLHSVETLYNELK